jgi:hypothetical protein
MQAADWLGQIDVREIGELLGIFGSFLCDREGRRRLFPMLP